MIFVDIVFQFKISYNTFRSLNRTRMLQSIIQSRLKALMICFNRNAGIIAKLKSVIHLTKPLIKFVYDINGYVCFFQLMQHR